MYDCKDPVKEYKYIGGWRIGSMVRVYDGLPKEGIHYLFKGLADISKLGVQGLYVRDDFLELFRRQPRKPMVRVNGIDYFDE